MEHLQYITNIKSIHSFLTKDFARIKVLLFVKGGGNFLYILHEDLYMIKLAED